MTLVSQSEIPLVKISESVTDALLLSRPPLTALLQCKHCATSCIHLLI